MSIIIVFQISLEAVFFKLLFFSGYVSIIFSLMYVLIHFCSTCPIKLERILIFIGFLIAGLGFITFFGLFNANLIWNISIAIGIVYLLMIELQLLGWTDLKQNIRVKITFAIALVSNFFLAYIFLFKVPTLTFKPFIYIAAILSVLALFYGVYIYQSKKTQ
jgi:hypothetical protein